jgi:hypothetical protein
LDRFRPVGPAEEKLVLRVANDQWRLDRAFPFEAGIYRDRFHDVAAKEELRQQQYTSKKEYAEEDGEPVPPPPTPPDEGDLLARAFNVDCEGPNSFVKLARYEGSIERSIDRCLRQLEKYQAARNAITPGPGRQPSPPPDEPRDPETATRNAPARAAAPSKNKNYHSNPKNGGVARAGVPAGSAATFPILLVMLTLLHAVPGRIAALASLLTDPPIEHKRREMNTFHRLAAAVQQVRQSLPLPKGYGDGRQPTASILCVPTLAPNP